MIFLGFMIKSKSEAAEAIPVRLIQAAHRIWRFDNFIPVIWSGIYEAPIPSIFKVVRINPKEGLDMLGLFAGELRQRRHQLRCENPRAH